MTPTVEGVRRADDVYRVGTVLRVVKMLKFPDDSYRLLVQGVARVRVERVQRRGALPARAHRPAREGTGDLESVEMDGADAQLSQQFGALVSESSRLSDELQVLVANLDDPSKLADLVASNLELDVAGQAADPRGARRPRAAASGVLGSSRKEGRRARRSRREIKEKVQNDMGKTQREYMLRQQLEAIRRELGESEDSRRASIASASGSSPGHARGGPQAGHPRARPAEPRPRPRGRARRDPHLSRVDDRAALVEAPRTARRREARRILDEDHYGLEKVKDRIVEYIAVLSLKRDLKGPILCFVGPPGTGKTSLGRSIARALGREFARISLGRRARRGRDPRTSPHLRGRAARPHRPGPAQGGHAQSGLLLDEVDKVGSDGRGDPSSALLEVLDPEQNSSSAITISRCPSTSPRCSSSRRRTSWTRCHAALRDRMEVIELPGYTLEEKVEIARALPAAAADRAERHRGHRLRDARRDHRGVLIEQLHARGGCAQSRARDRRRLPQDRAPRRRGRAADGPVRVGPRISSSCSGRSSSSRSWRSEDLQPGVAVGLAWTPSGGDILFVESTRMPGQGELKLTGSLGDVMRESVEAARSWLRTHADDFGIDPAKHFDERDIHVHVPSGACPRTVRPRASRWSRRWLPCSRAARRRPGSVAMTGEITLRGKVLPVGGIKEKVLAAKRAGIERVILPEKNRRDVEEISDELLEGLSLSYVGTIDEALRHTLST